MSALASVRYGLLQERGNGYWTAMAVVSDDWRQKMDETLSVIEKARPSNNPTLEDIGRLHELHARHEREAGRYDRAEAADERAKRVRALTRRAPPRDKSHPRSSCHGD